MSWLYTLYVVILIVTWITSGVFITTANIQLSDSKNKDPFLNRAYWMSFTAAFITWFLVAAVVLLIVLGIIGVVALFGSGVGEAGVAAEAESGGAFSSYFSGDALGTDLSWVTILLFVLMMALVATTGILASIAANNIKESNNSDTTLLLDAYNNCVISAIIGLGVFILFVIGFIVYIIYDIRRKRELEALQQQEIVTRANLNQEIQNAKIRKKASLQTQQSQFDISSINQLYRQMNLQQQAPLYTTSPQEQIPVPLPQARPVPVAFPKKKEFISQEQTIPPIQRPSATPQAPPINTLYNVPSSQPIVSAASKPPTPSINTLYNVSSQTQNPPKVLFTTQNKKVVAPVSILKQPQQKQVFLPPKNRNMLSVNLSNPPKRRLTGTQVNPPVPLAESTMNPTKSIRRIVTQNIQATVS
jgi:uncharacterized membrane protein